MMGREGCSEHEALRAKSSWLSLGPTQSLPKLIEKHLVPSQATDAPDQEKTLVCFVMTESFASFAGVSDPGDFFLKRVLAMLW